MYAKTHGNILPGAQRSREYQWKEGLNPSAHSFGYGEDKIPNGAAKAVHAERFDTAFPKTIIVQKTVEDFRQTSIDHVGQSKNLGQGQLPINNETRFGVPNGNGPETWNAARCINGDPSDKQLEPDRDLGRCLKPGSRNCVRQPADEFRVFGCPTVRTDIPKKKLKSVADHQNYGDEPEAIDVLFPQTYSELGISEYDSLRPRHKSEIKSLFEKIGYTYKIGKFNAIFNRGMQHTEELTKAGCADNHCCIKGFMFAVAELHNVD